jgi:D-xylose transport system substrate-binding protein
MDMRRRARSVLVGVAAFSLLAAACGDDDDDSADETPASEAEEAVEDAATSVAEAEEEAADTVESSVEEAMTDETTADSEAGGEASAGGEGSIWVLLPDTATSPRWEQDDRRFFQEAFEEAGLSEGDDFTIVNAEGDPEVQLQQAEQAINDGASVIVLTSNDSGSGAAIIEVAEEGGAAVVEYDRFNNEGPPSGDVYVSFDNEAVGRTMAEVLEPAIDDLGLDQPAVVMLNGGPTDNNSTLFRAGYAETAEARAEAGDWTIVDDQFVPDWDAAEGQAIFDQILVAADNEVNGVFAANDNLAQAVISSLETAGIDPTTVPISGQDASVAGIQNVLLGKQTMSVYKPIEPEARVAADAALALRAGEDILSLSGDEFVIIGINADGTPAESPEGDGVIPYMALTPTAVTADNVADTVIADGFRTVEELCEGDTAETEFCQENS